VQIGGTTELGSFDALESMLDDMMQPVIRPKMATSDWQTVIGILQEMERGYFASSAGPDGQPWAPNRPRTVQKKGHGIILRETWELQNSLTGTNDKSIREIQPTMLEFGTNRPWAWLHQEGGRKVPQRQFIGMNDAAIDDVVNVVADAAVRLMFQ